MKVGLAIADFSWRGQPGTLAETLRDISVTAEEAGFSRIAVMDHLWQIGSPQVVEQEMLEAYTTLGFLAAHTSRAKLLTLVTGVVYRHPGILAKQVTTLDVLSGGRAMLGIGAAWNDEESRGLGVPFPPVAERFERLEETLRICRAMFAGDEAPIEGRHYRLERPLNSPAPLSRPRPPILVGGGGERKTLRLVARYADACNLFDTPDLPRKLDVLREHCAREGRDYDEITKTCALQLDPDVKLDETLARLRGFADVGIEVAILMVKDLWQPGVLERVGTELIPAARDLG